MRVIAAQHETRELRRLLGLALDALYLPGHTLDGIDRQDACLLSGRYCLPFWPPTNDDRAEAGG
jgi:hypothetical protein